MSRPRRLAFLAVVALQALVPLGLVAAKETHLATGRHVLLRAGPVDPIDPFRGRYVALTYEISSLPVSAPVEPGEVVYVRLRRRDGAWSGRRAETERPDEGTFIRGRVVSSWRGRVRIEYGIETYYADEDEAPRLERELGRRRLYVDVALDGGGGAAIDGIVIRG